MNKILMAGCAGLIVTAFLIATLGGCTATPDSYPVASVNGEVVTLKEVESFPGFKNLVDELIRRRLIAQQAAKLHVEVDPARVTQELEKMKKQIGPGPSFQQWLVENNVTEEQVREQIAISVMFEELLKREVTITEDEVKANFEQNPKFFRQLYGRENELTTEESDKLSFEDMKDWLMDYFKRSRGYSQAQDMVDDLMKQADIEYLFMSPDKRAALKKQQAEERKQEVSAGQSPVTIEEDGSKEGPSETAGEPETPANEAAASGEEPSASEEQTPEDTGDGGAASDTGDTGDTGEQTGADGSPQ